MIVTVTNINNINIDLSYEELTLTNWSLPHAFAHDY